MADVNYLCTSTQKLIEGIETGQIPSGTLIVLSDAEGAYYKPPGADSKVHRIAKEKIVDSLDNIKLTILDEGTVFFAKSGQIGLAVKNGNSCDLVVIADRVESPSTQWKNYRQGTDWVPASESICVATGWTDNKGNTITFEICEQDAAAISDKNCNTFFLIASLDSTRDANYYQAVIGSVSASIQDGLFVKHGTVEAVVLKFSKDLKTEAWTAIRIGGAPTLGMIKYAPANTTSARVLVGYGTAEVPPQFPHVLPATSSTLSNSSLLQVDVQWIEHEPASSGKIYFKCEPVNIAPNIKISGLAIKFRKDQNQRTTVMLSQAVSSSQLVNKVAIFGGTLDGMTLIGTSEASASEVANVKSSIASQLAEKKLYGFTREGDNLKEIDLGYVPNYHLVEAYTDGVVNGGKIRVNVVGNALTSGYGSGNILYHFIVGSDLYLAPATINQVDVYSNGERHSTIQLSTALSADLIRSSEIYIEATTSTSTGTVYTINKSSSAAGLSSAVLYPTSTSTPNAIELCAQGKPITLQDDQAYHFHYNTFSDVHASGKLTINGYECEDSTTSDTLLAEDLEYYGVYTLWKPSNGEVIKIAKLGTLDSSVLRLRADTLYHWTNALSILNYSKVEIYGSLYDSEIFPVIPSITIPANRDLTIDFSQVRCHPDLVALMPNVKRVDGVSMSFNIEEGACLRIVGYDTFMSKTSLPIFAQGEGMLILDKCVQARTYGSSLIPLIQCNCNQLLVTNSRIFGIFPDESSLAAAIVTPSTSKGVAFTGCVLGDASAALAVICTDVGYAAGNIVDHRVNMTSDSPAGEYQIGNIFA